jgi:hypothetical protein
VCSNNRYYEAKKKWEEATRDVKNLEKFVEKLSAGDACSSILLSVSRIFGSSAAGFVAYSLADFPFAVQYLAKGHHCSLTFSAMTVPCSDKITGDTLKADVKACRLQAEPSAADQVRFSDPSAE